MKGWVRRIRAAVGMGLTWAVGWAPVGAFISLIMEALAGLPPGSLMDLWVMSVTGFGFVGGALFSVVLRLLGGRRRFDELSAPGFATWGALGGLALGALGVSAGLVGASFGSGFGARELIIIATTTLLSSGSATASLLLARRSEDEELLAAADEVAAVGLSSKDREALSLE